MLCKRFCLVGLFGLTSILSAMRPAAKGLEDFRWEHRLILLRGEAVEASALQLLAEHEAAISERDVLWFALGVEEAIAATNYDGPISPALKDSLKAAFKHASEGNVLLIGKDGGVKLTSVELQLDELFRLIDSMPMRRAEMRQ